MDEFYQKIFCDFFYHWIINRKKDFLKHHIQVNISSPASNLRVIEFIIPHGYGKIIIWNDGIIEEEIFNEKEEHLFYLHFYMTSLKQATYLFNEFVKVLLHYNSEKKFKIALCCTGGLSTSLFSIRLAKLVEAEKLNYDFEALSVIHLKKVYQNFDAILLAPQISYLEPKIIELTKKNIPIFCIEAIDYATNNYHRVLMQLNQLELSHFE